MTSAQDQAIEKIIALSKQTGIDLTNAVIRRSSSRFCFGVEHGDYNGTQLFGVGTDRFIWLAYQPRRDNRVRIVSANFPDDGVIEFELGNTPQPKSDQIADTWARFPFGVDYILRREGFPCDKGFDAVLYGNIPGGGMSRSASLALNLILTFLEVNQIEIDESFRIVELARMVENDYIGSPCGLLDQIMIFYAKENMATLYNPVTNSIDHIPLGPGADNLRLVVMDTGTVRPGLEKSTYKIRRSECEQFVELLKSNGYNIQCLADVKDEALYKKIQAEYAASQSDLFARCDYIYHAQKRFDQMLTAWKNGDVAALGSIFRQDGIGLRDDYNISGPELETMCDIVRTVPGVYGERMLGGGDKGAAGAIVDAAAVDTLTQAVQTAYPRSRPDFADKFAVHTCKVVEGIKRFEGLL